MSYKVVLRPGTRKGIVFVAGTAGSGPPSITLANGQTVTAVRGDQAGGTFKNNEGANEWQYVFKGLDESQLYAGPFKLSFNGESVEQSLKPGAELRTENGGLAGLDPAPNKAGGGGGAGGAGGVAFPTNLVDEFPEAVTTTFEPIQSAPYKFTDPMKFGEEFGAFQRKELQKNFNQAGDFALQSIDNEFKALESYVPKSAGIKRFETAADNVFNQQQRTDQVNQAVPDVVKDLNSIASDARDYASGKAPDAVTNQALEIGIRSNAADAAQVGGFGVNSSASRKTSDLMSARERIALSQYGEGLLSSNAAQRTNLFLAPTQYSNAGQQVNVMPSLSGSQLTQSYSNEINSQAGIRAETGLQSNTQQNQFTTAQEQNTRTFNASNTLQNDQFNATNLNNFALGKFEYKAQYASNVQQSQQAVYNIAREDDLREQNKQIFEDYLSKAQKAGDRQSIIGAVTQLVDLFGGFSGFLDELNNLYGSDLDGESTRTPSGSGSTGVDSDQDGNIYNDGGSSSSSPDYNPGGNYSPPSRPSGDSGSSSSDNGYDGGGQSGEDVNQDGNIYNDSRPDDGSAAPAPATDSPGVDADQDGSFRGAYRSIYANNPYSSSALRQFFRSVGY